MQPPGSRPGVSSLATIPARRPKKIQDNMLIARLRWSQILVYPYLVMADVKRVFGL